jgi:hypothetical protein
VAYPHKDLDRANAMFGNNASLGVDTQKQDVAVVISLNRFLAPVDDTVTAHPKTQVTSHKTKLLLPA